MINTSKLLITDRYPKDFDELKDRLAVSGLEPYGTFKSRRNSNCEKKDINKVTFQNTKSRKQSESDKEQIV
jgi:hypothetical protein